MLWKHILRKVVFIAPQGTYGNFRKYLNKKYYIFQVYINIPEKSKSRQRCPGKNSWDPPVV